MKAAIVLGFVTLSVGGLLIWQSKQEDKYCIEQWFNQTSELFEGAAELFTGLSRSEQTADDESNPDPSSSSDSPFAADEKLEALLPVADSKHIDWSVKSDNVSIAPQGKDSEAVLPNLFDKHSEGKTRFSGQLHLDESDNIVGAEVNVEIPTN